MTPLEINKKKIKVLIVEDSPTVSLYLEYLLKEDPEIEVVGNVSNGKLAVEFVEKNKPDIVTMDIDMPVMNGLDATRIIMERTPLPIIIVTISRNAQKLNISMEALAAGALSVIQKPKDIKSGIKSIENKRMVSMIKIYSQVKVIKRRHSSFTGIKTLPASSAQQGKFPPSDWLKSRKYIAIGISSGGPGVLKALFDSLSENFPLPIVVVQHITEGFLKSMVLWLNGSSKATIKVATKDEILLPGHVYFAPNGFQMGVNKNKIELLKQTSDMKICPSIEFLFNSLKLDGAGKSIAMLLTGMGSDGAHGLKQLKDAGSLTIAQDKESSLVHGMPGVAIELNGADYIFNPGQIIALLQKIEDLFLKEKN